MIYTLVYVSSATSLMSGTDLRSLMLECRAHNAELGITGMLLYRDGNIMQLLEGEADMVRGVYDKIAADPRHRGLITLWVGYQATRQFPDWTMGFRDLAEQPVGVPGYTDVLTRPVTRRELDRQPSLGQELLETFKQFG